MTPQPSIPPADLERFADLIAQRILSLAAATPSRPPARPLVDAAELARVLGASRSFVYAHANRLGAIRLGDGPRARLRFDPLEAQRRFSSLSEKNAAPSRVRTRRSQSRSGAPLLPIGRQAA
jgi:hypothetical protein